MPHQERAADFLAMRGFACLWDLPGLGKTASTIRGADRASARKVLVVCPGVVKAHWANEFARWQEIERPINLVEGFLTTPPGDGVTIISHACLADVPPAPGRAVRRNIGNSFPAIAAGAPYDAIIIDEAAEFRDYNALRARNLWAPGQLASWSRHVWALTGTPLVNSAADLWLLAYGPLQQPIAWFDWCQRFCEMKPDPYEGQKPTGIKNSEGLAEFLRPHVLRRTLDSIGIDLPSLDIQHRSIPLPPDAMQSVMADLEGWTPQRLQFAMEEKDDFKDAAMSRVRRALGVAKAYPVAVHLHQMLTQGSGPVVVFFHHTDVRKMLFEMLSGQCGFKVSWIDGGVTPKQLKAAQEWFQGGRLDVLLVQTQAGGTGLTLTRANRVVIAELPWTAVALYQAIKRVHRITQTRPCIAEVLRASECWLEDVLASVIGRKHQAAEELLSRLVTG